MARATRPNPPRGVRAYHSFQGPDLPIGGRLGRDIEVERRRNTQRTATRIRIIGLLLGMAIAATVVGAEKIPAGAGVLGADVSIVVAPTGELGVKHSGSVLTGNGMTPASDPATGQFQILNQTMFALRLHVRGVPDTPGLDGTLWVELTGPAEQQLFRGPLGDFRDWDFRDWTESSVTLASGVWSTFGLKAWIPSGAGPGYEGRMVQVDLGFHVSKVTSP